MVETNELDRDRLRRYLDTTKDFADIGVDEHVRQLSDLIDQFPSPEIKRLLWIFKALKNSIRIKLLFLLFHEPEICFCEFVVVLGLSKSTISHHLNILEYVDLIQTNSRGKWKYYIITDLGKKILDSLENL